jgi:outer membrane protein assembly factor BamA
VREAARVTCLATAVLIAAVKPVHAIEELGAEEDVAELLPSRFPGQETPPDLSERKWAVLPILGYGPDTGALAGGKFEDRDIAESGTTLDLEASYALNKQQSVALSIGSPHLLDDRFLLLLRAKYYMDPQRDFFGLGNNDVGPQPASTNLFQEIGGALTVGWRPFERVAFNFAVGVRQVHIRNGDRNDSIPFTPEAFPNLPGVKGGVVNPLALSLVWNTRDDIVRPTHGWRVILKAIHTDRALFSDFEFTRYVFDAGYLRSFSDGRQVVGLRVDGEWINAPSQDIPFWELSELGGEDTLRGFFPHRFVGKARALLNGEFRFRITEFDFYHLWHVRWDGVLFGDGGRVFISQSDVRDEFHLNSNIFGRIIGDFQYSYGVGVRIALSEALCARIDVGFSEEETGLVYLSFGQTF